MIYRFFIKIDYVIGREVNFNKLKNNKISF